MELDVKCVDFLTDNPRLYAHKARRKKIAMLRVEVMNRDSSEVRLLLGESKLLVDVTSFTVEDPAVLFRKLSEFTWDMAFFLIIDFHPLLSIIDFLILITGPLYNRLLRRRLRSLLDGDLILKPGKSGDALIGFRRVPKETKELEIFFTDAEGTKQTLREGIG